MTDWAGYLGFDILTDFLLGQGYNLLGSAKHRLITHHIKSQVIRPAVCSNIPLLALLKIDKLLFREATRSMRPFWRWVKSAISNRSQRFDQHTDVFAQIQLSRWLGQCPTAEIQSEIGMLIVACEQSWAHHQALLQRELCLTAYITCRL